MGQLAACAIGRAAGCGHPPTQAVPSHRWLPAALPVPASLPHQQVRCSVPTSAAPVLLYCSHPQRLFPGDCLVCEMLPKEEHRGATAFSLQFHVLR